jgi:hypothetical protein
MRTARAVLRFASLLLALAQDALRWSGQQRARRCGHRIPIEQQVVAKAILGGLRHEYSLQRRAA